MIRLIWSRFREFLSANAALLTALTSIKRVGDLQEISNGEHASTALGGGRSSRSVAVSCKSIAHIRGPHPELQKLWAALFLPRRSAERENCLQAEVGLLDSGCHRLGVPISRWAVPPGSEGSLHSEQSGVLVLARPGLRSAPVLGWVSVWPDTPSGNPICVFFHGKFSLMVNLCLPFDRALCQALLAALLPTPRWKLPQSLVVCSTAPGLCQSISVFPHVTS